METIRVLSNDFGIYINLDDSGNEAVLIPWAAVVSITAQGNYLEVFTALASYDVEMNNPRAVLEKLFDRMHERINDSTDKGTES